jgi:methionyl-tRNA synthetase
MKHNNFYVTTPLYYVNSKPHLGTLYSTLLADITARWQRLCGKSTFFLTGTDEHGQKIQEKAALEGAEPQQFVDSMIPAFKDMWKRYDIVYDRFIRTTETNHKATVHSWIRILQDQGDIYKAEYTGWYCVPCETFVNLEDDSKPGHTLYECPSCNRQLSKIAEENYFFRLSAYEDRLLAFYEENPNFITPKERINEVISFVKAGLKDLSISRKGLTWGIPFPGDDEHVVYVWADALLNYVSAIGYGLRDEIDAKMFETWWPANVQIMAKDIVRFHAVYWPAFLMAANLPLPKKLLVHGYILSGDSKMSKSKGNVVDPGQLADEFGVDAIRYYLARTMSVNQDGNFDRADLKHRIAGDLANNLGNLLNRVVALALSNGLSVVESPAAWEPASLVLRSQCAEAFRDYSDEMNHYQYHQALAHMWKFISLVNAYINQQKPWELAKENKEYFKEVIAASCHALYSIGVLLEPVMPKKMESLLASLGHTFDGHHNYEAELRSNVWNKTFNLAPRDEPLFVRPEQDVPEEKKPEEKAPVEKAKAMSQVPEITIDVFAQSHLIVGTIVACEDVESSSKLYKLTVDCGSYGVRTILSGVRKFFEKESLIGKQGTIIANLPPRMMMGLESQGMMLFAKNDSGGMELVAPLSRVPNGARLS